MSTEAYIINGNGGMDCGSKKRNKVMNLRTFTVGYLSECGN